MTPFRRGRRAVVAAAGMLVLAACTATPNGAAEPGGPSSPGGSPSPAEHPMTLEMPGAVHCDGTSILDVWIPVDRLLHQRPATELGPRAAAAVQRQDLGPNARGLAFEDLPTDWFIGEESSERVILLQPYPLPDGMSEADAVGGWLPAFAMRFFLIDPPKPADPAQWFPASEGECTFRVPLEDLTTPEVMMDAGSLGGANAEHLDLLVLERDCNSGRSAEGRIEVVALRETEYRIEIALGIRRDLGGATCPSNPLTPFRVELDAPLGERAVFDVGRVPPREVTAIEGRD